MKIMPKIVARDNLLKSTTVVGLMTFLSRISGLIRDIIYARLFGALPLMDAFLVAFRVPNSFRRFLPRAHFLEHLFLSFQILRKTKMRRESEN